MLCRIQFRKLRYEGPLTPPSIGGSIQYPGFAGGMNWGSVAVHEDDRLLVVQSFHLANRVQLTPRSQVADGTSTGFGGGRQLGTPYLSNTAPWLSPISVPCQRPPYGEMAVVDLKTRQVVWQRPLGTANALGPLGLKIGIAIPMGVPYSAGSIVTRSGLIFVGGTMDGFLRAIDLYSGRELWRDYLPNSANATPMSYLGPASRRQFIVIAVPGEAQATVGHGEGESTQKSDAAEDRGGYVIAYALKPAQARPDSR
jgi:quinate dehydrogenase (quinone)